MSEPQRYRAGVFDPEVQVVHADDPAIVAALAIAHAAREAGLVDGDRLRTFTTTTISWHEQEHVVGVTCPPFHKLVHFTVPIDAAERAAVEAGNGGQMDEIKLNAPLRLPEDRDAMIAKAVEADDGACSTCSPEICEIFEDGVGHILGVQLRKDGATDIVVEVWTKDGCYEAIREYVGEYCPPIDHHWNNNHFPRESRLFGKAAERSAGGGA